MKTLQIIKQDQDKTISLVEHETTHTKYIQKELNYYTKEKEIRSMYEKGFKSIFNSRYCLIGCRLFNNE